MTNANISNSAVDIPPKRITDKSVVRLERK